MRRNRLLQHMLWLWSLGQVFTGKKQSPHKNWFCCYSYKPVLISRTPRLLKDRYQWSDVHTMLDVTTFSIENRILDKYRYVLKSQEDVYGRQRAHWRTYPRREFSSHAGWCPALAYYTENYYLASFRLSHLVRPPLRADSNTHHLIKLLIFKQRLLLAIYWHA